MSQSPFDNLAEFRCIGPFRGGRVVAVAGDPRDTNTFYFGGVCGGVWKTTDAGQYWENISDGYFTSASVGALEVAPADPNVIYAARVKQPSALMCRSAMAFTNRLMRAAAGSILA